AAALRVIGDGAPRGRFRPVVLGSVPPVGREVAIDADQSNESTVVGDAAVLKLYPRTTAGPQPGLELPAHLVSVGFGEMPAPLGALVWDGGDADVLVATAATYLHGARDGWEWCVDALLGALDGDAQWPVLDAASLGGLTGRFHAAMATSSEVLPEPVTAAAADTWFVPALAALDGALADTDGAEGDRLRALAGSAREALAGLDLPGDTPVLRIHGDLHVGQVLRWEGGDALSDFDGNPLAPAAERVAPGPAARDVASMARAIDHVGRICQRRRPGRDDDVRAWIADARAAFLAAYRAEAPAALFDERLLLPLEVAQECHEYRYAARYLPRWRYVPDLAMPDLLAAIG
ncbi:MAG: hypothetical protein WD096_06440, partial [Actinomycetota bacterium]